MHPVDYSRAVTAFWSTQGRAVVKAAASAQDSAAAVDRRQAFRRRRGVGTAAAIRVAPEEIAHFNCGIIDAPAGRLERVNDKYNVMAE
jgi:hypothetical protein